MSRGARLSIVGLYNYNPEIFKGFQVPAGMDRAVVINEILMECGELELVFPSYNFMKMAITNWTKAESKIWEKLFNTENLDYNPIWNVDGTVEETTNRAGNNKTKGDTLNTGSTKGFNETDWLNNAKDTGNSSGSGEWADSEKHTTRRTGNIGVTTTQKMIREEREIADFTTIKYIVHSFKKRFCVMIY